MSIRNLSRAMLVCVSVGWLGRGSALSGAESFIHTDRESAVVWARPDEAAAFSFAIFGDQTGAHDPVASLQVWQHAIGEMNILGPDMVMTVGDMINGYNQQQPLSSGFLNGERTQWIRYPVTPGQQLFVTLSDHDTLLAGELSGNRGKIHIELDVVLHEFKDPTR